MSLSPQVILLSFLASLALSFLMSGMESGVFALSRLRIRQHVRAGHHRASVLLGYLEHPEHFLWTILVGNTLANLTAVSLVVSTLYEWHWLSDRPVLYWGVIALLVLVFYSVCDLLPKMLFRTYPNRLCLALALPFRAVDWLLSPLVWVVGLFARLLLRITGGARFTGHLFGNRDELRLLMQETGRTLTSEERAMINRVLDLQSRSVGEILRPMEKVVVLPDQAKMADLWALRRTHGFSRYPVYRQEGARKRIIGFVNSKRLLYDPKISNDRAVSEFLKPSLFVDSAMRLDVALRQMQRTGQRLAIVLGTDQTELGIVSLADILQTIFGEVRL